MIKLINNYFKRNNLELFFFNILVFFSLNLKSQTYPLPSNGAQWNIVINDPNSGTFCTTKYVYKKDTFICGNNYSIISLENSQQCNWWNPILLRSVGNLVYGRMYTNCSGTEYLLYNFNLSVGDTFIVSKNFNDTAVVIEVTYPTMLNGQIRKKILLKSINGEYTYTWIEGIGDLTSFYYMYNPPDPILSLLCFHDSSGFIYKDNYWNNCDTTNMYIEDNFTTDNSFIIYPNPVNEITEIKYNISPTIKDAIFIFYDITGKIVKTINISSNNNVLKLSKNEFNKSVYICSLKIDGVIINFKKILWL